MPTLHLKNDSNNTIPFGGKVGSILAGSERSIVITTSEFEMFRPKLEKFKGKLRFWTDLEDNLQKDVSDRVSVVNEAANQIKSMQRNLEKKTKAALSTCLHCEETRLITCPKEPMAIFCEDLLTPKQGSWLVFIECNTHSPSEASGTLIIQAHDVSVTRPISPGPFFTTTLLPNLPTNTKVNVCWSSVSGSLRMTFRSISLLQVAC